jgi:hypothetical protein
MGDILERLRKHYTGRERRDVTNPCITAREAIDIANHIHLLEQPCDCTSVTILQSELTHFKAKIAALEKENESLRDLNWVEYVALTARWLEKYQHNIFTGVSGDSGPLFVVAVRNALKALQEQES